MMTIEQIDSELSEIADKIRPLAKRADALNREKSKLQSVQFINANGVTRDNIEMSQGDDKPWFGMITEFAAWMRETGCQKRFCEWSGMIYFTEEIKAGRMDPNAAGRVEDVK